MFRLEKVFQNDDSFFINGSILIKSLSIYFFIYIYSILENETIYHLLDFETHRKSNFFLFSIFTSILYYFVTTLFFKKNNNFFYYNHNIFKKDFYSLTLAIIISILSIKFIYNINIDINLLFLIFLIILNLIVFQFLVKKIYKYLVDSNIIQKNVLLIGNYESLKKILLEKKNDIHIYKCCILIGKNNLEIIKLRSEFRIQVFSEYEDIRSLLEYHSLGQIWILNDNDLNLDRMLNIVLKFSVDIIVVNLFDIKIGSNLLNKKYNFINYEISKFHGSSLLLKIILDKILSLLFLIILLPVLIICIIFIYIEDGKPIFFTQDRTGWDGRRFKIYKLRSLKNLNFSKTKQVLEGDDRLLKIGKFIRKFSIDEVPQFFNVLTGDMSIVGPRPHMVEHDIYYSKLFKEFLKRHKAPPGLTGWAQINGLRGPTIEENLMKKRMEFDMWYLDNWSITLDLKIILKTFFIIFKHKGV